MLRPLAPILAAAALAAVPVSPARAAFPGHNGRVAVSYFRLSEPDTGTRYAYDRAIELRRADRGSSQTPVRVLGCRQVTDETGPPLRPVAGDCSLSYLTPAFSPDGRWIAFDAGARIALVRANGTGLRLLPPAGSDPGNPTWSPGGGRVAFDSPRGTAPGAASDLYIVGADGRGEPAPSVRGGANPSWSARGLLAFERGGRIWVSRSSGARAHPVSALGASAPDFAPGRSRLVHATRTGRLTTVGADGRGRRRLAAATAGAESPAYSPDGRRLAWGSFDGPVYAGRADGSRPRAISTAGVGAGYDFGAASPSWQPVRR